VQSSSVTTSIGSSDSECIDSQGASGGISTLGMSVASPVSGHGGAMLAIGSGGCLERSAAELLNSTAVLSNNDSISHALQAARRAWAPMLATCLGMPLLVPSSGGEARPSEHAPVGTDADTSTPFGPPETTTLGAAAVVVSELLELGILSRQGPGAVASGPVGADGSISDRPCGSLSLSLPHFIAGRARAARAARDNEAAVQEDFL